MAEHIQTEIKTYNEKLPDLLTKEGKFVVIKGDEVIGTFDTYADAILTGRDKFKGDVFLVKQIAQHEQIFYFTRDFVDSCQA